MSVPAYFKGGTFDGQKIALLDGEPPDVLQLGVAVNCAEYAGWLRTETYRLVDQVREEDPRHSSARCGRYFLSWHYEFVEEVFDTWEGAPEPAREAR